MLLNKFDRAYVMLCLISIGMVAIAFGAVPIVYDTLHLRDTLFLAEAGWRTYNGLEPTIDFGHLYGGITAHYIAVAMAVAGPTVKALDYAALLQAATCLLFSGVVAYRRLGAVVFCTLALLCTALVLARAPLEEVTYLSDPISAHSFIYNRFGTALMACIAMFVLVPAQSRAAEDLAGLLCGAACFILILTKPTFFLPTIAVFSALTLQLRWRSLLMWTAGFIAAVILFDPLASRFLGSLEYNIAIQGQGNADMTSLIRKAIRLAFAHQLALLMGVVLVTPMFAWCGHSMRQIAISALILMIAYFGTAVSFGPAGLVGHQALPLIAGICLAIYECIRVRKFVEVLPYAKAFSLVLCAAVAFPHMANTLATSAIAISNMDKVEITTGGLANYLARSRDFPPQLDKLPPNADSFAIRSTQVAHHFSENRAETAGVSYSMLVDGLQLLSRLGDLHDRGIVSGSGIGFSFAMLSKPVPDFPIWPTSSAPELAKGAPLSTLADIVMLSRLTHVDLGEVLKEKMRTDFSLCLQSGIWSVYTRTQSNISRCKL